MDPRSKDDLELLAAYLADEWMEAPALTEAFGALLGAVEEADPLSDGLRAECRPDAVGIWSRSGDGSDFVRHKTPTSHFWADVDRIRPAGDGRRIGFIGESVARGTMYHPLFCPAQALRAMLSAHVGEPLEVVDLAAADIRVGQVMQVVIEAHAHLGLDAMVVFAGNNWHSSIKQLVGTTARERQMLAVIAESGGADALYVHLRDRYRRLVERFVAAFAGSLPVDIPVVVVVPEWNLADWQPKLGVGVPWLAGDRCARWWALCEETRRYLRDGKREEAIESATSLIALDGGVVSLSHFLLGRALLGRDDARARAHLELARDNMVWDVDDFSPRCTRDIQDGLRGIDAENVHVVDVPKLFDEHMGGAVPGWDLFIDHCHMTSKGIGVVMAAVAAKLSEVLRLGPVDVADAIATEGAYPDVETECMAQFWAASHNWTFGQSLETVRYRLGRAMRSKAVTRFAPSFLEMRARRVPAWLAPEAHDTIQKGGPLAHAFITRYSMLVSRLDHAYLEVVAEAIDDGGRAAKRLESIWLEEADQPSLDLLDDDFNRRHNLSLSPDYVRHAYIRYREPVIRFFFVWASAGELELDLCLRTQGDHPGVGSVRVNGAEVQAFSAGTDWRSLSVRVAVRSGINCVAVRWPDFMTPPGVWAECARGLRRGATTPRFLDACQSHFGDISVLRVSRRRAVSEPGRR